MWSLLLIAGVAYAAPGLALSVGYHVVCTTVSVTALAVKKVVERLR